MPKLWMRVEERLLQNETDSTLIEKVRIACDKFGGLREFARRAAIDPGIFPAYYGEGND